MVNLKYVNAKIGNHNFIFTELTAEQSQENFNIIDTPLINGGHFFSYGEQKLMKWTAHASLEFTSTKTVDFYNDIINELESVPQMVYIPKIGKSFKAMIRIKKSFDKNYLELEMSIQQILEENDPKIDLRHIYVGERIRVFDYDNSTIK